MSIFLFILKIIGILLLIILGIVLLIALLVLFCPLTYRIRGSYHDKALDLHARAFWLIYLLGICADVSGNDIKLYLRILGIQKSFPNRDNTSDFEDTIRQDAKKIVQTAISDEGESSKKEIVKRGSGRETSANIHEEETESFSFFQKIKTAFRKGIRFVLTIAGILKNLGEHVHYITELISDEANQSAFKIIGEKLFQLLKILTPRKLELKLDYSTGSPDTTGQLLGILALFPMGYQNRWNITPDFTADENYAEADFDIRGHVYGIQIFKSVLGIVLDKNCQKLYNRYMSEGGY